MGFDPVDFTAISATQWWVLGCRQGECPAIATTSDGGDSWNVAAAPSAWGNPLSQPGQGTNDTAIHLRFADAKDGWAFGSGLYATHDGEKTWSQVDLGGAVEDLEPGLDRVYAVVSPPCGGPSFTYCPSLQLWSSPITSNAWSKASVPEAFRVGNLAVQGNDVYLQVTDGGNGETTGLLISTDRGHRFSESQGFGYGYGCSVSPVAEIAIWAFCPTGMLGVSFRSTDGGGTFTGISFRQANCSGIVGVSGSVAVAASCAPGTPLWRTVDGGQTFAPVQSAPDGGGGWSLFGFTNPLDGYALWNADLPEANALWHTTDGGQRWSPATIQ